MKNLLRAGAAALVMTALGMGASFAQTAGPSFRAPADFPDSASYGKYLATVLQKGQRVRAAQDYEKISEGDLGWFHSMDDGEPPILVVWDKDIDATPWVDALPEDLPRILSGRVYFVFPDAVEIVEDDGTPADFDELGREWRTSAPVETLFPIGSRVVLGRHAKVRADDPDSAYWDEGMEEYAGREAVVLEHEGPDPWDRPLVTVDIDGGEYYWRAENLELIERGGGEVDYSDSGEEDYALDEASEYQDEGEYEDFGSDTAGMVAEGSKVILGRHDAVNGGDNWAAEMEEFVGMEATVLEILGADSQGFTVVSVEENDWSWRIRSLAVVDRGEPGSYGFATGDEVILGRHRSVDGSENWNPSMDAFEGRRARIVQLVGTVGDSAGCFLARVDIDQGKWVWRVESMVAAP